jgi:glycosyltransferase involved in cell wall biosynthesis
VVDDVNLIAMMVVHNEADRYLQPCLRHLLDFCDEIRILDDGSTDEWNQQAVWWDGVREHEDRIKVRWQERSTFYEHEGNTRQALLDWTMEGHPTHILAIDADEFIGDGELLRLMMQDTGTTGVWKLTMTEVWKSDEEWLYVRQDGDWRPRPVGIAFEVPPDHYANRQTRRHWRMMDRALACGRTPIYTTMVGNRTVAEPVTPILHFGWACEADRAARYARYVEHDGGAHHASKHLNSIMWGDDQVKTSLMRWPEGLDKTTLLARANRT